MVALTPIFFSNITLTLTAIFFFQILPLLNLFPDSDY